MGTGWYIRTRPWYGMDWYICGTVMFVPGVMAVFRYGLECGTEFSRMEWDGVVRYGLEYK